MCSKDARDVRTHGKASKINACIRLIRSSGQNESETI